MSLSAKKLVISSVWVAMAAFLLLAHAADHGGLAMAAAGISCSDAISALIPCGGFLLGQGTEQHPTPQCCQSVLALNRMASTVATRQQLCQCLKQTGPSFGVKPERARQLPPLCKLKLNIAISPNVDCSKLS